MNIQMIPLSKLVACPDNVRKTDRLAGVEELAASIAAHGLLQNLQVRPVMDDGGAATGRYEVIAGSRRLAALQRLAKQKRIARSLPVGCQVRDADAATEIGLAENIVRVAMHPADQFDAFQALADQGRTADEIAGRFGLSARTVRQRLELAAVSPQLFALYRAGEMTLEQLSAFTVTDDHAAQEAVWFEQPSYNRHPSSLRRLLTRQHVEASDRRVRFVGLSAYEAAGGSVLRDLFDAEHDGWLTDPALLECLVAARLETAAAEVQAEGWRWVDVLPASEPFGTQAYDRLPSPEPTPEQEAERSRLAEAYDALIVEHGEDPEDEALPHFAEIEAALEANDRAAWSAETRERAGAVIGIAYDGSLAVARGLTRPEDRPAPAPQARPKKGAGDTPLPAGLVEELTWHRTLGLREAVAEQPETALLVLTHALALAVFYPGEQASCLTVKVASPLYASLPPAVRDGAAGLAMQRRLEGWSERLPEEAGALWTWLAGQDTTTRQSLLAACVAASVDAVARKTERFPEVRLAAADTLAAAAALDMTAWWQPTANGFFGRVTKARTLAAVREAVSVCAAEKLAGLKRDALAAAAERKIAESGWLPELLRTPVTHT